jgi:hypothetical protein
MSETGSTVTIRRDPFARTTLTRARVRPPPGGTCSWCGGTRRGGRLFRYITESDSGAYAEDIYLFCSLPCRSAFRGD